VWGNIIMWMWLSGDSLHCVADERNIANHVSKRHVSMDGVKENNHLLNKIPSKSFQQAIC